MTDVATRTDLRRSTAYRHLRALRALGLVDWTDGLAGTLRPTVRLVAPRPKP